MTLARREFLRLAGLVAGGAAISACSPIYRELSGLPASVSDWSPISASDFRVLSRLTYGPTVQEREAITRLGWQPWVENQLGPGIGDPKVGLRRSSSGDIEWRLRPFDSLTLEADALAMWDKEDVMLDLKSATLLRRVYSRRQLHEQMMEFWTDHFNISIFKGDCWFLKVVDDREVVRKHALGSFRDLLWASAHSPAMLVYLDNQANEGHAPNENYARELMELHTLGVDGGYTQQDVMELARCFTGWTVKDHFWRGEFTFNLDVHDQASKNVLGRHIQPAGRQEAESVLEQLALHPATAHRLATKLARRFVSEQPRPELIEGTAAIFLQSGGSIEQTLRHLLFEGLKEPGPKVKRPVNFVAGSLRTLGADTDGGPRLQEFLTQMGQPAFGWPTPDGPPDDSQYWTSNLMPRWRFAMDLSQNLIEGTQIDVEMLVNGDPPEVAFDRLSELMLGMTLKATVRDRLLHALRAEGATEPQTMMALVLAGLLASPGYQWT